MASGKNIKLTYFNMNGGLGEPIRLALAVGGVDFTDERLTHAEFGPLKATYPFGQLPVLTVDGEVIAQSNAILRLAGKWAKLYPSDDDILAAHIDEIMDGVFDIQLAMFPSFKEKDQVKKLAMRKTLADETFPLKFGPLEKMVGSDGYAIAGKTTLADIKLYVTCCTFTSGIMDGIPTNYIDAYPKIKKIMETVAALPQVAAWNKAHAT